MEVFILRHAIAEVRSRKWPEDSERPLTKKGISRMKEVAEGMAALGLEFDLLVSSPFIRAAQTAEIVAKVFKLKVHFSRFLQSGGDGRKLVQELNSEYQENERLLLVGHEPDLTRLVSMWCCGDETLAATLKKGGLCRVAISKLSYGKCGSLEWLLTPAHLRAFADL